VCVCVCVTGCGLSSSKVAVPDLVLESDVISQPIK